ncbi:MAG: hypothetical protein ACE15B_16145 [Bryobacteraceae bacterium]
MCSSRLLKLAVLPVCALLGQDAPLDPQSSIKFNLPADSPVAVLSANMGESRAAMRGSATVIDLHMGLTLRNAGARPIAGVTLLVTSQEGALGGKGSVATPCLNVQPGDAFPVRIDLRLMRPMQAPGGPLVQVSLDGVLFRDLSFYGPNRLDSRRTLTAWEMEAQRDRAYFKQVLAAKGQVGLQAEVLASLQRQAERPRLNVAVSRGPAVSSAALGPERVAKFAFLQFPDSPVVPIQGWAQIAGNEARAPRVEVRNRSGRPVRYVEIGWVVTDQQGRQFMAAQLPGAQPDLYLPPGRTGRLLQETALKFTRNEGQPVPLSSMAGFVSQVEFADGELWIPDRRSLANAQLLGVLAASAEEQRLTEIYRKRGLAALVAELNRY